MAFDVYPQNQTPPLSVPSVNDPKGKDGITTSNIQEHRSGGEQPQMFIRVAILNSATMPTLKLQVGKGAAVEVVSDKSSEIFNDPDVSDPDHYVGDCLLIPQSNGVSLILVLLYLRDLSSWNLTIVNKDAVSRDFTFVVADSDNDSQQPWIEVQPTTVQLQALIKQPAGKPIRSAIKIANYGTGALTQFSGVLSGPGAAGFSVDPPADPTVNPNSATTAAVKLLPSDNSVTLSATLDINSNDTRAKTAAGHNKEVALSAAIGKLEVAFLLDASGSMAYDPDGQTINIAKDPTATRWGRLRDAVDATLTTLKNFASDRGDFAVGVYPDITKFPPQPSDPPPAQFPAPSFGADFHTTSPISVSAVSDAVGSIHQHFPRVGGGWTPTGAGIEHAIGAALNSYGYFSPSNFSLNRRWLILMSDGQYNIGDHPSLLYDNGSAGQGFAPKQIQAVTIGYGDKAAPIEPVNEGLLKDIAAHSYNGSSSGRYYYAQADATPDLTVQFIKALLVAGLPLDSISDPGGVLTTANPTVSRQVNVTPYDHKISFIVAWSTSNAERLRVQVRTPLGELIEVHGNDYTVDVGARYRILTFDQPYLANTADPTQPRYGTWTLILTLPTPVVPKILSATSPAAASARDSEIYSYHVVTESRLNLRCALDKTEYVAGDSIGLTARLTLDGQGIPSAAVSLTQTVPGMAHLNWLAATPVTSDEYGRAAFTQKDNPDIGSLGIKQLALATKGQRFTPVMNSTSVTLTDPGGTGTYGGLNLATSVPGTYDFLVTAVGALPDGSVFRREEKVSAVLGVRPDPAFTLLQIAYASIDQGGQAMTQATLTVRPRDRFGNYVMIDPRVDPSVLFTASSGSFDGPIVDNHDGSYSRSLTYPSDQAPVVGVSVGGVDVTPNVPLVNVHHLHWVNRVFSYEPGGEAVPGANHHKVANDCLGNLTKKTAPRFVSLGAGGSLVVGISGHYAEATHHGDDITVFVHPDTEPRPYSVEVSHGDYTHWFEIGRSPGVTQSFKLRHHGHPATARVIRIRDRSLRVRNPDGTPSTSPGVSILGVGCRHIERGDGDFDDLIIAWLRMLGHMIFG